MDAVLGILGALVAYSFGSLKILRQYERGVSFFLGRYWGTKGPGVVFVPLGFAYMKIPEILLVETVHKPGSLASVLQVIADEQLVIQHLQSLRRDQGRTLWEITVEFDESANPLLYARIDELPNARFVGKSDRVFNRHRGGKIRM